MPALSCLRCPAYFLDAVGPRGWRDGCGAQVARCVGTGTAWRVSDGEAREQGAKPVRPCRVPRAAGRGGHKRDGRGAHAASRPGPRRRVQSPFGRTACRCRGKAGRRWQHLRAMRDFGLLDAKKGPWRQDSRAMYPKSPDCTREWMHRARMLPS